MIYFSPKILIVGLSGIGVTAGGLAAWRLTKRTNPATPNSTDQILGKSLPDNKENMDKKTIESVDKCGKYIWDQNKGKPESNKNDKNKDLQEYIECYKRL